MLRCLAAAFFTSLVCTTHVLAQDEQRQRVIGEVLDKDGNPWPNAKVTLLSRAIPGYERGTRTDSVSVASNARGRFRADLLPSRPYSAWAVSAIDETSYRATEVAEDVLAGRPVSLHEAPERHFRVRLTVHGRDAWKSKAPLRFTVHTCTPVNVLVEELVLDENGRAALPQLPGGRAWVEVHGANEYPIYSDFVPLTERERDRYAKMRADLLDSLKVKPRVAPSKSVTEAVLDIPAPRTVTIQVDDAHGKPIAGAQALRDLKHARGPWYPLATGDANGRIRFAVPALELGNGAARVRPFDLLVRHADHADNCLPTTSFSLAAEPDDAPDKTAKLAAGRTVTGRILFDKDRPAKHLPLVVYSSITRGDGGGQIACGPHTFYTDDDGRFALPGRADGRVYRLCAVPGKQHVGLLPNDLAPQPLLWLRSAKPKTKADPGDIRLDELRTVVVEIERPDGAAAPRETVYACEDFESGNVPFYPLRYLSDRRGKLQLCLPDATSLRLVVASRTGALSLALDPRAKHPGGVVRATLTTECKIEGKLTDTDGNPLPRGKVLTTHLQGVSETENNWITIGMLARHNKPGPGEPYWTQYWKYRRWSRHCHPGCELPVDADGRFKIFVPSQITQATLLGRVFVDGVAVDSPSTTVTSDSLGEATITLPLPANSDR